MIPFFRRFFSDEGLFQRVMRGAALGGAMVLGQTAATGQVIPVTRTGWAALVLATFGGMIAAPTVPALTSAGKLEVRAPDGTIAGAAAIPVKPAA